MIKVLTLALLLISPLLGEITVEQIMATARHVASLNNIEFKGKIKGNGRSTPILLKMQGNDIQLWYTEGNVNKGVRVVLNEDHSTLFDITDQRMARLPKQHFATNIVGSDFTYEDFSLRFLYWPRPQYIKEETIKTQSCYVIRVMNPADDGNYKYTDLWIAKKAFALMKMHGYDAQGNHIKTLEPSDLMNVDDKIMMKKMKVQTIKGGRVQSDSYMILENPEGVKKTGRPRKLR